MDPIAQPDAPPAPVLDPPPPSPIPQAPLVVNLDGALLATDPTWEALLDLIRSQPSQAWRVPLWAMQGAAALRQQLASQVAPDAATLPYRAAVADYLRAQRAAGRPVVLVTDEVQRPLAEAVARHLGLGLNKTPGASDGSAAVIAVAADRGAGGVGRLQAIRDRLGAGAAFDYLTGSRAKTEDAVAAAAQRAIDVRGRGPTAPGGVDEGVAIPPSGGTLKAVVKAIRPHQWAKNVLLFVPLITAHRLFDPVALGQASAGFVAFCLAASAGYLFNDLLDLKSDRLHPSKRRRPLASGRVSVPVGLLLFVALLGGSLAVAGALSVRFLGLIVLYLALTTSYSCHFKRKLLVDVICLGSLYTLRIFAGGVATSIVISTWLLAFSMFIFLSLAFVKRYTEVVGRVDGAGRIAGRGYYPGDLDMIRSVGTTCGGLAVLVVCLYINSPDVTQHYRRPDLLWLACPVFLYWISRIWFLAQRQEMNHDPVVFALGDRISYLAGAVLTVILLLATPI